jgi:CobQ/CobB/MinD/ParA nucleotide binding domain
MQSKGGVGKSFVAWVLAQWHAERGIPLAAFDTDPQNVTFASFEAFNATHIKILADDLIDVDGMDGLIETIVTGTGASVVDNGSSSFLPMARYLLSNNIANVLAGYKRRLILHTAIVGGQLSLETLGGMEALLTQFPATVPVVVWVNEHTGEFSAEGMTFEDTAVFKTHRDRIAGVIYLPYENPLTHGRDVKAMLTRHWTFAEAVASPEFKIVAKSRLLQVRDAIFAQLDRVLPAL